MTDSPGAPVAGQCRGRRPPERWRPPVAAGSHCERCGRSRGVVGRQSRHSRTSCTPPCTSCSTTSTSWRRQTIDSGVVPTSAVSEYRHQPRALDYMMKLFPGHVSLV